MKRKSLDHLVEAWNCFIDECRESKFTQSELKDEIDDFRRSIHECERILAMQECKKVPNSNFYRK